MKLKSILKTLFIISIICGINSCKEKKNEKIKEVKVVNENKKLGLKNAVVLNLKNLEKNKKLDFKEKYRKLLINPKDASNSEKKIVMDSWMNFHEKLNNFIKKEKFERWAHLTIHSTLHLLGYTHDNKIDQKNMENTEIDILKKFDIFNPYEI